MQAYMISYLCFNTITGIVKHGPMIKTARSNYEAEGMVVAELQASFPASAGWANHSANAIELTAAAMVVLLAKVTTAEN